MDNEVDHSHDQNEHLYVQPGLPMKYVRLFALLMRMRQTCCHPFLVLGKGSKKVTPPPPIVNAIPNPSHSNRVTGIRRKENEGIVNMRSRIS